MIDPKRLPVLVQRAQHGDTGAFDQLVRDFQDMAVGYGFTLVGDFHMAEDAAQEAFLTAYRQLKALREPQAFPGWFRSIVRTACSRMTRRKLPLPVGLDLGGAVAGPDSDEAAAEEETMDDILEAVRALPESERSVITLSYVSAYTHQEIADFLGVPVTTVRGRLRMARERLKKRMLTMAKRKLSENAPSRDARFEDRVKRLVRPEELKSEEEQPWQGGRGTDVWAMITAAIEGDLPKLQRLAEQDARLVNCSFQYRHPLHFAVQEGHVDVVRYLLENGADATYRSGNRWHEAPIVIAAERGHAEVEALLAAHLGEKHHVADGGERFAEAIRSRDAAAVDALLKVEPELLNAADERGNLPIHWAALTRSAEIVDLLLSRGADINARRPDSARPLDLTNGDYWFRKNRDVPTDGPTQPEMSRLLIEKGATYDITAAAKLGDIDRVRELLAEDASMANRVPEYCTYYNGLPLWEAVSNNHTEIVKLLLDSGADPTTLEPGMAPQGRVLMSAVRGGDLDLIRDLLERGCDPNAYAESSGTAMGAAVGRKQFEALKLMASYGGRIPEYVDLSEVEPEALAAVYGDALPLRYYVDVEDLEMLSSRFSEDPAAVREAIHLTMRGNAVLKRGVLKLCLESGLNAAKTVHSGSVMGLLHRMDEEELQEPFRWLLEAGMTPNDNDWLKVTPLHRLAMGEHEHGTSGRDYRPLTKTLTLFIEFGADLNARDEEYLSTPLGWAARWGRKEAVALLLEQGAKTNLPDDPPWATPLAWALKKGHVEIEKMLIAAGAA